MLNDTTVKQSDKYKTGDSVHLMSLAVNVMKKKKWEYRSRISV